MYEVTPSAGTFLINEAPHLAQLLAIGSISGWAAHRLVGFSLDIRGLKVFLGLAGLQAGAWLWQSLGWQPGPMVGDFSLLASLVGTIALCGCLRVIELAVSATAHTA
jgi:uncharacterized membrane protein YeaQ/YmgE (transglycosylase-associated protein family)